MANAKVCRSAHPPARAALHYTLPCLPLRVAQDARSKMLEVLDRAMRAQADERAKKMDKLEEKYAAASAKRVADLAKQQKELPPPAFVAFKVSAAGLRKAGSHSHSPLPCVCVVGRVRLAGRRGRGRLSDRDALSERGARAEDGRRCRAQPEESGGAGETEIYIQR